MKNFSDSAIIKTRGYKMNDFNKGYYTGYENAMNDMKAYITKQLINNSKAEKANYSPSWPSYDDQGKAIGIQGYVTVPEYNAQYLGSVQRTTSFANKDYESKGAEGIPYDYGYQGNGPTGPIGYMP